MSFFGSIYLESMNISLSPRPMKYASADSVAPAIHREGELVRPSGRPQWLGEYEARVLPLVFVNAGYLVPAVPFHGVGSRATEGISGAKCPNGVRAAHL